VYRATVAALRSRSAKTRVQLLTENDGDEDLTTAREIALAAQNEGTTRAPLLTAPAAFDLPGIPLANITQKIATQAIRSRKSEQTMPRTATRDNVQKTRERMKQILGHELSDEDIWKATQYPDFSKRARNFLWLLMHDAHRCGKFLANWGGEWIEKSRCSACADGPTESLDHILFHCSDPAAKQVWKLAESLWQGTGRSWPGLNTALVLGCGAVDFKNGTRRAPGASRLYRILISESARLIWSLRCTRRIEHADEGAWEHPPESVEKAWWKVIDDRFTIDRLLTNQSIYGKRALQRNLVLATWSHTLDLSSVPDDWIESPGVLVGRRRPL
ncbi:hypothetical protein AURDEDRAFT_51969, partial [Auricularia subglabra TFB-10046 SS5]